MKNLSFFKGKKTLKATHEVVLNKLVVGVASDGAESGLGPPRPKMGSEWHNLWAVMVVFELALPLTNCGVLGKLLKHPWGTRFFSAIMIDNFTFRGFLKEGWMKGWCIKSHMEYDQ